MRLAELTGVSFDIYYFCHLLAPSQIIALEIAASKDRASSVYFCVLIAFLIYVSPGLLQTNVIWYSC